MIDPQIRPAITRDARTVAPSTPVREAAQHLREPSVPALVVRDDGDGVVGIVTESDLVALLAETGEPTTVAHCMSSPVTTVRPTATVTETTRLMRERGVKRLPVVDERAVYRGLVTASTLAPYCSRRSLDVEWTDDPLRVDAPGTGSAAVGE